MKKSLLAAAALGLTLGVSAQMPDNVVCPDFTGTDLDGVSHNLYDYLDQGYTVIVDVSATWCGPCWSYHNSGALENLYEEHGPGTADDKVMVLFVEGDNSTTIADLEGTGSNTQGDWVTGTPYPIINSGSIANLLQISYFPTIYKICPNRIITEVGQLGTSALWAQCQTCPVADSPHDAMVLPNLSNPATCVGTEVDLNVRLQNVGTSTLTAATVQAKQGATVLASTTWTGLMPTYGIAEVNVGSYAFPSSGAITYQITTTDDDAANNTTAGNVTVSSQEIGTWITIEIRTDAYPSETTWELLDENGYEVVGDPPGSYAANTVYSYTLAINDGECYVFQLHDSYGDGLTGAGYYKIINNGVVVIPDASFTFEVVKPFKGSLAAGVSETLANGEVSIYPNPTNNDVTLSMGMVAGSRVTLDVYNVLGERVKSQVLTNPISTIGLSDLNSGVYYFNIIADGVSTTRKVTVNK